MAKYRRFGNLFLIRLFFSLLALMIATQKRGNAKCIGGINFLGKMLKTVEIGNRIELRKVECFHFQRHDLEVFSLRDGEEQGRQRPASRCGIVPQGWACCQSMSHYGGVVT